MSLDKSCGSSIGRSSVSTILRAVTIVSGLSMTCRAGTVITDGSLGHAMTLSGPNYSITANLGQTRGGNLFQSFKQLDLSTGDIATFSGPTIIKNVISRVTGGAASTIDGTLRCTIPHADFFLINPAGVIFGPSAALDLNGSFTVTTADEIKLAEDHAFSVASPSSSSLTSAAPAAFGFLAKHPATITINGSLLRVPQTKAITIAAGPVTLSGGALLRAPTGTIGVLSLDAPADVPLAASPTAAAATVLADVTLSGGSVISTTGIGGGRISVQSHDLTLNHSGVEANTEGKLAGRGIDLQLSGALSKTNSFIDSNTFASGDGGNIDVQADSIIADGTDAAESGVNAKVSPQATGHGGSILVKTRTLSLTQSDFIATDTAGPGHGGEVSIVANQMTVDGTSDGATLTGASALSLGSGRAGQLRVHADTLQMMNNGMLNGDSLGPGRGSDVSVTARSLTLSTDAEIRSDANAAGAAGNLAIAAGQLTVDGQNTNGDTAIVSDVMPGSTGAAGAVSVRATSASLLSSGFVGSDTSGAGPAGSVKFNAKSLTIDGGTSHYGTGIAADANNGSSGPAGSATITANTLSLQSGGAIVADTNGLGRGGDVHVTAKQLLMDGRGTKTFTGIATDSDTPRSGAAGSVVVHANSASIVAGGKIQSETFGSGRAGDVAVVAGDLKLDGRGSDLVASISSTAEGSSGAAGAVRIHANHLSDLNGAEIDSDTLSDGRAGDVSITANAVRLSGENSFQNSAYISSDDDDGSGAAGNVSLHAKILSVLDGCGISSDTYAAGHGGDVSITANRLHLSGTDSEDDVAYISADAQAGTGSGGNVFVRAASIKIANGAGISSDTYTTGLGGKVSVYGNDVAVSGTDGQGDPSYISSVTSPGQSGAAGQVLLHADSIDVTNGGEIESDTAGQGHAGDVKTFSRSLKIDGQKAGVFTGIFSNADAGSSGSAGSVFIHSTSASIVSGGQVSTSTNAQGRAGDVLFHAAQLRINGDASTSLTGIASQADNASSGDGGSIFVNATAVTVQAGGEIVSDTHAAGNAGGVTIVSDTLRLDGATGRISTAIASGADPGSTGSAGTVKLTARSATLLNGAFISSDTFGPGDGGDIAVTANKLTLDGGSNVSPSGIFAAAYSTATAGKLALTVANSLSLSDGAQISTDATGGAGGNVDISSGQVRLRDSSITTAAARAGGDITLDSTALSLSHDATIVASSSGSSTGDNGGDITIGKTALSFSPGLHSGVISANAARRGVGNGGSIIVRAGGVVVAPLEVNAARYFTATGSKPGNIQIQSPQVNLISEVAPLLTSIAATNLSLAPVCGMEVGSDESSFTFEGGNGLPFTPDRLQPSR